MRVTRIALAQMNPVVGDLPGNADAIRALIARARDEGCDIVAFPELAVTGYPPEDLLLRRSFCEASRETLAALVEATEGIIAVVGFVDWRNGEARNAAAVLADGRWVDTYDKVRLPNYGVFDEERYFAAGYRAPVYRAGSLRFGVGICEDIWYPGFPLDAIALGGAELYININASPYHVDRRAGRERMLATRANDNLVTVAYLNMVGGQDELVFDGGSVVFDASAEPLARAGQFAEELLVCDVDLDAVAQRRLHEPRWRNERRAREIDEVDEIIDVGLPLACDRQGPLRGVISEPMATPEEVWNALVTATRDYIQKSGFREALIGLSGGLDSAVVATIAADAVGADAVTGVAMPSRFSSDHSLDDARQLAANLGIRFLTIPIEPAHAAMLDMLASAFEGTEEGTAEENLQSRQRGNVLMTLSNKFGALVLATGNKSEMATGYATLYGDMAGGYAVIKDVPKTLVYDIARWRNESEGRERIPERTITKPPSAELKPDQLDVDSLPDYSILDPILRAYVEDDRTFDEIVSAGFEPDVVRRVIRLVDRNEYKRRQAPPGVKITPRAFGRDRRLPLTNRFNGTS